jgi:hypothetical protein
MTPEADDIQTLIPDCGVAPDGISVNYIDEHIFWNDMAAAVLIAITAIGIFSLRRFSDAPASRSMP